LNDPTANAAKAVGIKTVDNLVAAVIGSPTSSVTQEKEVTGLAIVQ
jgi:hypothetical protein